MQIFGFENKTMLYLSIGSEKRKSATPGIVNWLPLITQPIGNKYSKKHSQQTSKPTKINNLKTIKTI